MIHFQNQNNHDDTDRALVAQLQRNSRIAMSSLADAVGMSAPSVTERVRRLEAEGVITAFTIEFDLPAIGYPLEAIVRIKPRPGALHLVEDMIVNQVRFTACDKVTGDDCFIARLSLRSIDELDELLDPFHEKAETNTAIVKSSPVRGRMPPMV